MAFLLIILCAWLAQSICLERKSKVLHLHEDALLGKRGEKAGAILIHDLQRMRRVLYCCALTVAGHITPLNETDFSLIITLVMGLDQFKRSLLQKCRMV